MGKYAAIDVGSNAMRIAVAQFNAEGSRALVLTHREPVRLGHDVFRLGRITPKMMDQALAGFLAFARIIRKQKVKVVRAVGTSALREAANSYSLIDRVARATGIKLEVISGEHEARLIRGAVATKVNLKIGTKLLIDIGGGSVEVTLVHGGETIFADSIPMGSVRMLEMLRGRSRPTLLLRRLVRQYGKEMRGKIQRSLGSGRISSVIGTGGNVETLGELRQRVLGKSSDQLIRRSELQTLLKVFEGKSTKNLIEELCLRPDRADVIVPATALLSAVLQEAGASELRIPKVGLRDGILEDLYQGSRAKLRAGAPRRSKVGILTVALQLGKRFLFDERHAKHVAKLCLLIFDQLKSFHGLQNDHRQLLHVAALLHDIGLFISTSGHHKHSAYLISSSDIPELTDDQRAIVAAIARYHDGAMPSVEHTEWRCLSVSHRREVMIMAGILRIAEELDKEHLRRVSSISIHRAGRVLTLKLAGRGSLLIERWGVGHSKQLLERALRLRIAVQ